MDPTDTLSLAESQALAELEGYGFSLPGVYIGRARAHFARSGQASPSVIQILEQVFRLCADEFLTISQEDAANYTRLRSLDFEATRELTNVLRETVALERAKRPIANPFGQLGGKIRLSLYPEKSVRPGTDQPFSGSKQIAGKTLGFKAWVGVNSDFVNLEITVL